MKSRYRYRRRLETKHVSSDRLRITIKPECGPMPNVMDALLNTGGALCSTPQSLADAYYFDCRAVTLPRRETR